MSDDTVSNIIEFRLGKRPSLTQGEDNLVEDSLELLRLFTSVSDPERRRAVLRLLNYMLVDGDDAAKCDGIYPP